MSSGKSVDNSLPSSNKEHSKVLDSTRITGTKQCIINSGVPVYYIIIKRNSYSNPTQKQQGMHCQTEPSLNLLGALKALVSGIQNIEHEQGLEISIMNGHLWMQMHAPHMWKAAEKSEAID